MDKAKFVFTLIIILTGFSSPRCRAGERAAGEITVYVTNSGAKYHRESCSSLRSSKIAVSLEDALGSGYEPCAVCAPPTAERPKPRQEALYRVHRAPPPNFDQADLLRMVPAEVVGHVDGDTLRVRIAHPPAELKAVETIRMIGVDTPETVHPNRPVEKFGREASDFTKNRLLGKTVYLAFDWDTRDRYGRLLAYIYTPEGCFNAALIREGYGHAYTRFPFEFMAEFRALEQDARTAKRGLWGAP